MSADGSDSDDGQRRKRDSSSSSSSRSSSDSSGEEEQVAGTSASAAVAAAAEEEDPNSGFVDPESPSSNVSRGSSSSEGVLVERPLNNDQDSRCSQGDPDSVLVNFDGSMQEGDRDGEDQAREDTFVDAPDQLGFTETRGGAAGGLGESMAVIEVGGSVRLEEMVAECRKYKEEREVFGREVSALRYQLQAMFRRLCGLGGRGDEKVEEEGEDSRDLMSPTPLHAMLRDCSEFVSRLEGNLNDQQQSDDIAKELHAIVCSKDEEIKGLNMKVLESSMTHDIIVSYLGSLQETWLESSRQPSDDAVKRMLASLASVGPQDDESSEDSAVEGFSLVEKRTTLLTEKYVQILSKVEQLGQSLAAVKSDFVMPPLQQELGFTFDVACQALHEGKLKESEFLSTISELEKEKGEVVGQLDRTKESLEEAKTEASKTRAELELAENKLVAVKEKLSMAVTKGKALVQQRDSLKQSLAEKTGEIDKCLQELQQKSDALEAAEASIEEFKKIEDLVLSLQDSLSDRDKLLQEIEEVMSQIDLPSQSMEIIDMVRWLVDQKQILERVLLVNNKLTASLSSFDLPESIFSTDLEYQINWLGESFAEKRDDLIKLEGELAIMKANAETCDLELIEARKEVNRLTATLLEENQEKDSRQVVHEDLMHKYEEVVEKLSRVSSEKNRLMRLLVEASEVTLEYQSHGEIDTFVEECMEKFRERKKSSLESSLVMADQFQKMQSLFYVENLELMLSKEMLEEGEILDRAEVMSLSNELQSASEEVITLRNERDNLRKDLERVEERSSLLREKLSMAVKKGKGLVQEREGFKHSLDEKNLEIEKLKHELKQQESTVFELKEQIKVLSTDLERIQELESDIVSIREEKGQLENFLLESNTKLHRVIHSIESIMLPTDVFFEEHVEKVKWIAEHIQEFEGSKVRVEQELEEAREQAVVQATKLADAYIAITSLQDSLSHAENHITVISEEKNNAQFGKTSAEQELEKVKEEASNLERKLSHSCTTIKSLEDALSHAENTISILTSEKNEIESKSKLDIISLNSRLAVCMEELAGTSGSLENQSAELVSHLKHLQMLTRDMDLLFLMAEGFRKKIDGLKDMGILIQNMHDLFTAKGLGIPPNSEHDLGFIKPFSLPQFEDFVNDRGVATETSKADPDDDIPSFTKVSEGFSSQTKLLRERFSYFSGCMDDHIAVLFQALQSTMDEVVGVLEHGEILKLNMKNLESCNKDQEIKISALQNSLSSLFSACNSATQDLQIDFHDILAVESISEQEKFNSSLLLESREDHGDEKEDHAEQNDANEYATAAKCLSEAARRVKMQTQKFANVKNMWEMTLWDLRNKLKESELTAESASQDRNSNHERVLKLEGDMETLQNVCSELKLKMEDYLAKEHLLGDKEAEIFSLHQKLAVKDREEHEKLFLEGQLEDLFDKVNKMEVSFKELKEGNKELHFPSPIDKLLYIIDNVSELQYTLSILTNEKEDMQSILRDRANEIEHLKKASEGFSSNYQDLENKRNDLFELSLALEKIIQKLGGNELAEHKRPSDAKTLLSALERLVIASNMETENLKSRAQELGAKLQATQMVVEELTSKVTLLEGSIQARPVPSDNKERSIFEPSSSSVAGSEISEIEDMGSLGKNSVSSVPAAAKVRTMRKGSNDHLSLNIDLESDSLISPHETDDKGHVFKSLNTSGFIPKQGKVIADRIDGIWVSGGRILMSRPGARIGLIAYCLMLHMWVLATIL